jgi:hypothetical protein
MFHRKTSPAITSTHDAIRELASHPFAYVG